MLECVAAYNPELRDIEQSFDERKWQISSTRNEIEDICADSGSDGEISIILQRPGNQDIKVPLPEIFCLELSGDSQVMVISLILRDNKVVIFTWLNCWKLSIQF